MPNFCGENYFVGASKPTRFMKVFSLESFPLAIWYGGNNTRHTIKI